jgi:diguanylate cyclase (GGDEF)-like protein
VEKIFDTLEGVPSSLAVFAAFSLTIILMVLYALFGLPALFPILLVVPVVLITLSENGSTGSALAIFSAAAWLLADLPLNAAAALVWPPLTNALIGLVIFFAAVYTAREYKNILKRERDCSHEDPLTGIPNLRGFFELAEREVTRSKRNLTPVSVAYLGLDNVDQVILKHGKKMADSILRKVAHSLVSNTRGTDVSARIGDADFVLLMSETGIEGGIKGIRRIQDLLMQTIEEFEMPVSFCVGLVTYHILPDSIADMIAEADALKEETRIPGSEWIRHQVVDL